LSGRQIPTSTRSGKFLYFKIILILFWFGFRISFSLSLY
jgi:hypothetical protein